MKIACPHHEESTPSCHLYPDGRYYSFCCGASGPISELTGVEPPPPKPKEDLEPMLDRIDRLPKTTWRGIGNVPYEDGAHYLVWPDRNYYLKRNPDGIKPKYIGPTGHPRPMYVVNASRNRVLVMVEGEINAMSLTGLTPGLTLASPGSATEFTTKKALTFAQNYDIVYLILDRDHAGRQAALACKAALRPYAEEVHISLWPKDANEILMEEGEEALSEELARTLGRL